MTTTPTPAPEAGALIERLEAAQYVVIYDEEDAINLGDLPEELIAFIRSQSACIAELEAEREKWKRQAGSEFAKSCELADRALTAEAGVERLRGAVEPFSNAADDLDDDHQDHRDLWEHAVTLNLTVGDLRTARSVYKETEE